MTVLFFLAHSKGKKNLQCEMNVLARNVPESPHKFHSSNDNVLLYCVSFSFVSEAYWEQQYKKLSTDVNAIVTW